MGLPRKARACPGREIQPDSPCQAVTSCSHQEPQFRPEGQGAWARGSGVRVHWRSPRFPPGPWVLADYIHPFGTLVLPHSGPPLR